MAWALALSDEAESERTVFQEHSSCLGFHPGRSFVPFTQATVFQMTTISCSLSAPSLPSFLLNFFSFSQPPHPPGHAVAGLPGPGRIFSRVDSSRRRVCVASAAVAPPASTTSAAPSV